MTCVDTERKENRTKMEQYVLEVARVYQDKETELLEYVDVDRQGEISLNDKFWAKYGNGRNPETKPSARDERDALSRYNRRLYHKIRMSSF